MLQHSAPPARCVSSHVRTRGAFASHDLRCRWSLRRAVSGPRPLSVTWRRRWDLQCRCAFTRTATMRYCCGLLRGGTFVVRRRRLLLSDALTIFLCVCVSRLFLLPWLPASGWSNCPTCPQVRGCRVARRRRVPRRRPLRPARHSSARIRRRVKRRAAEATRGFEGCASGRFAECAQGFTYWRAHSRVSMLLSLLSLRRSLTAHHGLWFDRHGHNYHLSFHCRPRSQPWRAF